MEMHSIVLTPHEETLIILMEKLYMSGWRNWQTRTVEGRVVYTMGVQVPLPTPAEHRRGVKAPRLYFLGLVPVIYSTMYLISSVRYITPEGIIMSCKFFKRNIPVFLELYIILS